MRRLNSAALLPATVSLFALAAAAAPSAASAQTPAEEAQAQACANLPAGQERENCLLNVGEEGQQDDNLPAAGAAPSDAIIVTGSRIARPNFDTIEPSVVINSEQIEARGFETLGQALNELPAFGVPGSSPVGGQSSFGPGQNFVNFLGLGSERTLTLVNGRRFVGSNTASIFGPTGQGGNQVDLNIIPTKLIDRVETIVIGGAPIYGSDAIAGTVNVILKRDYEGISLDAQYGISERGDAANYRFRGLAGMNFADGRGNVTIAGEYNRGEGLIALDRPNLYTGGFFARPNDPNSPFSNIIFDDRRIPSIHQFGVPYVHDFFLLLSPEQYNTIELAPGLTIADFFAQFGLPYPGFVDDAGNALRFDQNGNLVPLNFGNPVGPPGTIGIDYSGGNGYSLTETSTNLLTDTERYSGNMLASFDVSDNVRVFGEAWYSRSSGVNLQDQPEYNAYLFGYAGDPAGAVILSVDNPFLSEQAREIIQAQALGDTFFLNRANTDLTPANDKGNVEVMRFVLGLDGNFAGPTGRDWNWEVVGNYGRSETNGEITTIATQNFLNAVDAVDEGVFNGGAPNGNIICRPGHTNSDAQTLSSTCAPLNLFGNQASDAARDYVTAIARPISINKQKVFTASIAGPLFQLGGGDLSFALGYEHRDESQDFDPGDFFRGGPDPDPTTDSDGDGDPTNERVAFGQSVVIQPLFGQFNTDEVFGELRAALVEPSNDIPIIYSLELQGAARYVDHSVAGGDLTWTAGARYQPIQDITIRGNFTRAIRAPFITEAFNPSSSFFGFATDPCDSTQLNNGPDPATRKANCAADGIPADFQSFSDSASFLQAVAGNPDLGNEKSDSWTVGTVIRPRFIPGLSVSADYVDITVNNVITQLSGSQVVANCYDSSNFPDNDFCARIDRDPDNQLSFIETGYFNAANLRYKGVLAAVDYRRETPFLGAESSVGVNLSYQYLDTLTSRADADSEPSVTHGSIGYSRHQGVLSLSYDNQEFGTFMQFNYMGKAKFNPDEAENFRTPRGVGDVVFVNMGFSYDINEQFGFRFIVDNVFDTRPPYPSPIGGGTITYFPGVLGRYFRAGATVNF